MTTANDWDSDDWFWFIELMRSALDDRLTVDKKHNVNEVESLIEYLGEFTNWSDTFGKPRTEASCDAFITALVARLEQTGLEVHAFEVLELASKTCQLMLIAEWRVSPPTNDIERARMKRDIASARKAGVKGIN
jgi:hypothetical protein